MRYSIVRAGLGILMAVSAGMAVAGPLERDATSKALGDDIGVVRRQNRTYRAYSYAPSTTWTPATADNAAPATADNAAANNANRSFSYDAAPATFVPYSRMYRRPIVRPSYDNADRKILGEY